MSNCIRIVYKAKISLKPDQVDTEGLRKLIEEAEKKVDDNNCMSKDVRPELKMSWWFLSLNTIFKPKGGVDIIFGEGRSTHTWRDFRGALQVLSQFIKVPVQVRFGIKDEFDSYGDIVRVPVNLQDGKIK